MTTYRELIYMCLDLLKGESDDFTYTEEHIAYLLDKYRALLLKQRYGNDPKKHVPYSNYQTISLSLTQDDNISKSTNVISTLLQVGIPRITTDNYYNINFEFVNRERFPFVGNNKYLKKIRYASIDTDNKVVIKLLEPDDIDTINLTAIFENPRSIQTSSINHWMDNEFPLEESLVSTLIETVVNSLIKIVTFPTDTINNGTDENSSMPVRMEKVKNV